MNLLYFHYYWFDTIGLTRSKIPNPDQQIPTSFWVLGFVQLGFTWAFSKFFMLVNYSSKKIFSGN
ncbi:MAG: hypothetical protein D6813_08830 [Calditrichaeota bacterium]|nr:MAG: hypothetical protein D6813_08830 [Calditrichota bacterium]